VRAHNADLAGYGQRVVGAALGLTPEELPDPGAPEVAMRILPLPARVATTFEAATVLSTRIEEELATVVAVMSWGGRGWLRLCGQVYNRRDEYDRLAERLPAVLRDLR
jgi:isopenicillin-N epimerase